MKFRVLLAALLLIPSLSFAKTHKVKMLNAGKEGPMVFEPSFLKVAVGDTVEFLPTDPSHGSNSVFTPKGAKTWKGAINKKVTTKITKEGVYIYECQPHSMMGMVGVIQAGKASNLADAKKFADTYNKKLVMNKSRLSKTLGKVK